MIIASLLQKIFSPIQSRLSQVESILLEEAAQNRILAAQLLIQNIKKNGTLKNLTESEFKVFSQWGEDGIIQYLISQIPIPTKTFIEFGVEDYRESNTRFLLVNNNWSGLVMDGEARNIERIRSMPLYWRYDLNAMCAFITAENINSLIQESGIYGDIGLLSIDIDGNDYWVWKALSEKTISPRIVIVEYNSVFGKSRALTIPYNIDFQRTKAHFSNLYYGASLKALCQLASEKGYHFVGSNSAGNNAFFVRSDVLGDLYITDSENGYVESKVREARNAMGTLTFLSGSKRLKSIAHLSAIDLESNQTVKLEDLQGETQ